MRASPASPLSCGRPPCHHSPAMLCVCVCVRVRSMPMSAALATARCRRPLSPRGQPPRGERGPLWSRVCLLRWRATAAAPPPTGFLPYCAAQRICSRTVAVRLCALVHEGVAVLQELHRRLLDVVDSLARHGCGGTKLLPREVRHGRPRLPVSCRQGRSEPSLCLRVPTTRCSPRETDAWPLPDLRLR